MQSKSNQSLTYGATPATVGIMPRYNAGNPPSVVYMVIIVDHIPGSLLCEASPSAAKDADWIDKRVRTMSSGYVKVTDVIPAAPPQISLCRGSRSAPGETSTSYRTVS
jgi:hypothetical protein